MNKGLKVFIYILVIGLCFALGWFLGGKLADMNGTNSSNTTNNSTNNNASTDTSSNTNSNEKEDVNNNKVYKDWISYVLNQDIKSITYYHQILDENDPNFKSGNPSFYVNDLSKDELLSIFDSMDNSTIGLVAGLGGIADYVEIAYDRDGKDYFITITQGGLISSNDYEYHNILRKEVANIYNNMTAEEQELYGKDPIGNMIKNWDASMLKKYFSMDKAKVVYKNN